MPEQAPSLTRHDWKAKIGKHCWAGERFQKEFTADPKGTFVKYLNVPAASLPAIVVHQEEPGSWHIVLSAKPYDAQELSEQDLVKIAGCATPTILFSAELIPLTLTVSQGLSENQGGW